MSIFNFWRKRQEVAVPSEEPAVVVSIDSLLDGFFCKRCGATLFDDQNHCLGCKTPYSARAVEVALWHREAKWRLVKTMSYGDAARVLREATEKVAQNPKLSLKEVL